MSFPKLLSRNTVIYLTRSTVFRRAVPNFLLAFLTLELFSKLIFASEGSVANKAVQIVRLPRCWVFKIILLNNSRDSAMALYLVCLTDCPGRTIA